MPLTHAFSSSKSDGGDTSLVRPSNWNADHVVSGTGMLSGSVLYVSGSPGSVQVAQGLLVDVSGDLNILPITGSDAVITPASGATLFVRKRAGRNLPGFEPPSGQDSPLQPMIGMNKVAWFTAQGNATTVSQTGMTITSTGTATTVNVATTNYGTSIRQVAYVTAGSPVAGTTSGIRGAAVQFFRAGTNGLGGLYWVGRFQLRILPTGTNTRGFFGFSTSTANPANQQPSAIVTMFGVGFDTTHTQYQFMHNDGAGTATTSSSGINITQGDCIEVRLYSRPLSGSTIGMSLEVLSVSGTGTPGQPNTLAEYDTGVSTDVPVGNTLLNWHSFLQTTTGTIQLGVASVYLETDN